VAEHDDFIIAALLEEGRLSGEQVDKARRAGVEKRTGTVEALVETGAVTRRDVALAKAQICEVPFVDLDRYQIEFRHTQRVPRATAEALQAMPLFIMGGGAGGGEVATVGMANPLDLRAVDQLRAALRMDVETVLCEPAALRSLIERAYAMAGQGEARPSAGAEAFTDLTTGKEPIVAAVNQIMAQAVEKGASDVHLGPDETTLHLRFRIDGQLLAQQGPGLSAHQGIVQRLKVMANLDLTQSRRPQDGKFRFNHNGRAVDVRLSVIPTVSGENVVMRLLTSGAAIRGFAELGLPTQSAERLEALLDEPHGMILVTGPTGSGKTTTLYTCVKKLNGPGLNVMTIEDPVEIRMPLVRQVQVHAEIGMTFAGALRSILRQDPDVVMVGEIRDDETARIAVQAALTGHLVLSSLHTNDACGAIPRLRDFGCPAFAINASVLAVVAQRLVRRVCRDCSRPDTPAPSLLRHFGTAAEGGGYVCGAGCARCGSTGYSGRLGVYEVLTFEQHLQRAVEENATLPELRRAARRGGFAPMWQDGLNKCKLGLTTPAEVARVIAVHGEDALAGVDLAGVGPDGKAVEAGAPVRLSA
jgi:type II secretory ATPase GspE/PulE/Tfp pilus assembly ATPase PilB-like protein